MRSLIIASRASAVNDNRLIFVGARTDWPKAAGQAGDFACASGAGKTRSRICAAANTFGIRTVLVIARPHREINPVPAFNARNIQAGLLQLKPCQTDMGYGRSPVSGPAYSFPKPAH